MHGFIKTSNKKMRSPTGYLVGGVDGSRNVGIDSIIYSSPVGTACWDRKCVSYLAALYLQTSRQIEIGVDKQFYHPFLTNQA